MLAEKPDWKKGMEVWRKTIGYEDEPIKEEKILAGDFCEPRPDIDLKMMKSTSQIVNNIPRALLPKHLKLDEEALEKDDKVQQQEDIGKNLLLSIIGLSYHYHYHYLFFI